MAKINSNTNTKKTVNNNPLSIKGQIQHARLSWNEIRDRALAFSKEWQSESSERAEAKSFWDSFFSIFGISRRRIASFEVPVRKSGGQDGYIDLLWKGILLVEHKSRGRDLNRAFKQALDYFSGLKGRDLPRYVLVSDFQDFRLYDLDQDKEHDFKLSELSEHVHLFDFIAGYQTKIYEPGHPANVEASEKLGKLHDLLKESDYKEHPLELLLVRLLYCLFADDTGIFEPHQFREYLEQRTSEDGSDLGMYLAELFQVLNTPISSRQKTLDEQLIAFEYVNGKLFEEQLPMASFNHDMREQLLECCAIQWSRISPAIFGSLFQSIMSKEERRQKGGHYTSEANILKVIQPLFLDKIKAEFESIKNNMAKLKEFHNKLALIHILDPACGCGNFLIIAYRELRLLELEVLKALHRKEKNRFLDISSIVRVNVDQFYGIELEEFPAQIAQVALWLMDHQMNSLVATEFGQYFKRLPLVTAPHIVHGNALQMDWAKLIKPQDLSYIVGNPPFIGHHLQSSEQKKDMLLALGNPKAGGVLDFVTAWYAKAAKYIQGTDIQIAFVSTNSITQGEQIGILWRVLQTFGRFSINFAHRTFRWSNEAKGKAAVYCVIIGFSLENNEKKRLFNYETVDSKPTELPVNQINAYLIDAPWVLLENETKSMCGMPGMDYGSKPTDGGFFFFTDEERREFLKKEPDASKYIRPFIGAHEYLNNEKRWTLWLIDADPGALKKLPNTLERVKAVDKFRKNSKAASTRNYPYPTLYRQIAQPKSDYILVPRHTSENRVYIPFGFFSADVIVGDSCFSVSNATVYHFGVLSSVMHMAWVRAVCGRLESRYRYSATIVYNNFPWPDPTQAQKQFIEKAAQGVLDARAQFSKSAPAELYDPLTMPTELSKAHQVLDRAVDAAYNHDKFDNEVERVAFLFQRYKEIAEKLEHEPEKSAKRAAVKTQKKKLAKPIPNRGQRKVRERRA